VIRRSSMDTFICKHKKELGSGLLPDLRNMVLIMSSSFKVGSASLSFLGKLLWAILHVMPDFDVGCHLASLNDVLWNTERLTKVLGTVDGVTVAYALLILFKELGYPKF